MGFFQSQVMLFLLNALLILSSNAQGVNDVDEHTAVFVYPTKEEVYYQFDQVRVTYTSEIPSPSLWVWCNDETDKVHDTFHATVPGPNASYTVTIDFTSPKPCWFNLKSKNDSDTLGQNSPRFSVIGQTRSTGPETFGPETQNTPTSSDTSKPSTPSIPPPSNNTNIDNNNSSQDNNSGLSKGAVAGVAVGASLGGLAIAAGIFAYLWKRRRREAGERPPTYHGEQEVSKYKDYAPPPEQSTTYSELGSGGGGTGAGHKQGQGGREMHELDTANAPAEMPS